MKKHWSEVNLEEVLQYYKEIAAKYHEDLSPKEKEELAHDIAWFTFSDDFNKWSQDYPILIDIETFADNLSWSNVGDVDDDWEKLKGYINQLELELTTKNG